jgi:O-antigen/teichoic acid export membrane protein
MSKTATNIMIVGWIVIVGLSFVVAAETNDIGGVLVVGFGSLFWMILVNAAEDLINWPLVIETYHRRKREPLLRIIRHMLIAMAFIAVFALIGEMGYQDALIEQEIYAELVCDGTYPDYKNINPECN